MKIKLIVIFTLAILFVGLLACKREQVQTNQSVTITLYNKPLNIIQYYLQGKWRLQYVRGGISGGTFVDNYNSYINVINGRFTSANDRYGVGIDTTITWKKVSYNGGAIYLLYTNWYRTPYLVEGIYNDTLRITDYYVSDGYTEYYTRW